MSIRTAEAALERVLAALDSEDWERMIELLDEDVELADELTSSWLRGKDAVGAYLRAQAGVVTEIRSPQTEIAGRLLGPDCVLFSFHVDQRYLFNGINRHESLKACAIFRYVGDDWLMTLLHFGTSSGAIAGADSELEVITMPERQRAETVQELGKRVREHRVTSGFSLRQLASRSGLSASFLSQVERSAVNASVQSLNKIAEALGTTPAELVGSESRTARLHVSRSTDRQTIDLDLGMRIEPVASIRPGVSVWVTELMPDAVRTERRPGSPKRRLVYVLRGALEISGTLLSEHDAVDLGTSHHTLRAAGGEPVRFLSIQTEDGAGHQAH